MANPLAAEIWALRPWTLDLSSLDRDRPLSLLAGNRGLAGDCGLNFLCSTAQDWDEGYWPLGNKDRRDRGPISNLAFDPGTMELVCSRKTVVLDKSTKLPIILYSIGGAPQVGLAMRSHLEPLTRMPRDQKFNLSRTRDGLGPWDRGRRHGPWSSA